MPALSARGSENCDKTYKGLSTVLDILYSKFCVATAFPRTIPISNKHGTYVKLNWRRTKSLQKLLHVFGFGGNNFTESTADIRVDVERLTQVINRVD